MALKRGDVVNISNPLTVYRSEFGSEVIDNTLNTEYQVFCISDADDLQTYREMNPNDKEAEIRVRLRAKDGTVIGWVSQTELVRSVSSEAKSEPVSNMVPTPVERPSVKSAHPPFDVQMQSLLQYVLNEYGEGDEWDYSIELPQDWESHVVIQAITHNYIKPYQSTVDFEMEDNLMIPLEVRPCENFESKIKKLGLKPLLEQASMDQLNYGTVFRYRGVQYTKVDTAGYVGMTVVNGIPKLITLKHDTLVFVKDS